jgi:hypothetical protein
MALEPSAVLTPRSNASEPPKGAVNSRFRYPYAYPEAGLMALCQTLPALMPVEHLIGSQEARGFVSLYARRGADQALSAVPADDGGVIAHVPPPSAGFAPVPRGPCFVNRRAMLVSRGFYLCKTDRAALRRAGRIPPIWSTSPAQATESKAFAVTGPRKDRHQRRQSALGRQTIAGATATSTGVEVATGDRSVQ